MPSWWAKSSSKEVKNKASRESFIDTLHRKFKSPTDVKVNSKSEGCRKRCSDTVSELGSQSRAVSRSPSPTKLVSRCQSFIDRPCAQPLPLPGVHSANVRRTDSAINVTAKTRLEKGSKSSLFPPLPRPACIRGRPDPSDLDADLITASVSSETSSDNDGHACSSQHSPQATDYDLSARNISSSPSSAMIKDQTPHNAQISSKEAKKSVNPSVSNYTSPTLSRRRPLGSQVPNLQVPHPGALFSAPDSSMSSPSRSPMRAFGNEQVINSTFWAGKPFQDVSLQGSGHCSSPGSGYNSGHNSMGGDMSGHLFWQHSRGSPECSPIPSPRMNSPGAGSRVHSGAVTPIHPRAGGATCEPQTSWPDDGKQQSHRLPLPPGMTINTYSHSTSPAASPSVSRSPGRAENPVGPGSRWKKGKLLGRGTFGHVYVGFNSESGGMCAMKEVTLVSDDAKSKESAKQLMQEIALLSRLRHPNIVQYYGSKRVGDKLYIYLEYVSGGSIYKILQEYGKLGELAIRSYAQQIVSGLAYLHSKNTVHRDIKGANILVDPHGRVKLADFGMAKHVIGQSCPLSFKGSPYWMAPEVIKNSSGCHLAVDIWSLGCTILEMATTKPPWSQYEGVAAIFKIGNSKDLPAIPDHLSDAGKDFVRLCLQRNPQLRPTATQLLEHPFVKCATPLERPIPDPEPTEPPAGLTVGVKTLGIGRGRNLPTLDSERERLTVHSSRFPKAIPVTSDNHSPRNISCPVSPIGSPHLRPRSPQHLNGRMSPSPISSPRTTSGSSTPLTSGSGAIPYNHVKPSIYMQQGLGNIPKSTNGVYVNASSHHDSNPELFLGMQLGTHVFSERVSSENDLLAKHLGMSAHRDNCDGQTLLADCVSRQLLRDPVSLDLSPKSPLPHQTAGVSCNVPF